VDGLFKDGFWVIQIKLADQHFLKVALGIGTTAVLESSEPRQVVDFVSFVTPVLI
jgi:hypothetical protein